MEFIYEMHIVPEIDAVYRITEAFELLGWAPILSLPHHIYPDLVWEFYVNIDNKKGYGGEEIRASFGWREKDKKESDQRESCTISFIWEF